MFGARHGSKACTGANDLGGYISDDKSNSDWLRECMLTWYKNIGKISETRGKYPQESYAVVIHAIKPEWTFL